MNDRLPWRIFGLIYAHPHPREADTSIIRNRDDMPLPTDFANNPAREYLISKKTQAKRQETMQGICSQCHAQSWTDGHFQRLENTIQTSNQAVHTATQIMQTIWDQDLAQGLGDGHSPFDEHIEKTWSRIWLINANKIRFTSAMAGGGDYGVFAQGRYELSNNLAHMQDWLNQQTKKTD